MSPRSVVLPIAAAACLALAAPALADIRINEVESDGASDFIELVNTGATAVDVGGYRLRDSNNGSLYVIPSPTLIAAGRFAAFDVDSSFGLGSSDAARLYTATDVLLDSYSWTSHAAATYGRCPDGTGAFVATSAVTRGAANACPAAAAPWPGGASVATVDQAGAFGTDLSGLDYEGSGGPARGTLWAVNNGTGALYRLVWNGAQWVRDTANGWSSGKVLRYPDGFGAIDSEGVTLTDAGSAGGVFVSSERNASASAVSRVSVLRYDVSVAATTLNATHEWNLTADLPGLPANGGAESVEWIPDSYLVASGFVDQSTGLPYAPANYPGHGTGLFFVGIEATGQIYAYALNQGSNAYSRVATFASGFPTFGALHWDPNERQLWVVCDNNCEGRSRVMRVDETGAFALVAEYARPTDMPNLNNEGFAFAPDSECVGGVKPVYWADDGAAGGHALRSGTLNCKSLRNDLLVDFGAAGLYQFANNSAWTRAHSTTSLQVGAADLDGAGKDELIVSFSNGLFARYNNAGAWMRLHDRAPARFVTGNVDGAGGADLIADFGASGIWSRTGNATWTKLHAKSSEDMATGDLDGDGKDEVLVDFGASGLWGRFNNASWIKLHNASPGRMTVGDLDGDGKDDAIVDFGASGVWVCYNNATWTKLHVQTSQDMATGDIDGDGRNDVLIDFGASGLWVRLNNTSWFKLHDASPLHMATGDLDGNGKDEAILDFGASGIWVRYNNAVWTKLHDGTSQGLTVGAID